MNETTDKPRGGRTPNQGIPLAEILGLIAPRLKEYAASSSYSDRIRPAIGTIVPVPDRRTSNSGHVSGVACQAFRYTDLRSHLRRYESLPTRGNGGTIG